MLSEYASRCPTERISDQGLYQGITTLMINIPTKAFMTILTKSHDPPSTESCLLKALILACYFAALMSHGAMITRVTRGVQAWV